MQGDISSDLVLHWLNEQGHYDLADELLRRQQFNIKPIQKPNGISDSAEALLADINDLSLGGTYPTHVVATHDDSTNIIALARGRFTRSRWDSTLSDFILSYQDVFVVATADGMVKFYSYTSEQDHTYELVHALQWKSPTLCIAQNPVNTFFWMFGRMDGSVILLNTKDASETTLKKHSKYVNDVCWSKNGIYSISASTDGSLGIYSIQLPQQDVFTCTSTLNASGPIDAAEIIEDPIRIVYSVRGDYRLWYYNFENDRTTAFSLNPNGDHWASFNIICIKKHPHLPILSLQTDTDISRILIYPYESSIRIRTLYTGADQSEYSRPKHCWLSDGHSVAVTSDNGEVHIVSLKGTVVASIIAHGPRALDDPNETPQQRRARLTRGTSSVVRCLVPWGSSDLITGGFDKTIRLLG